MFKHQIKKCLSVIAFAVILLAESCATISKFDQYSYTQATSLKVDALNVMNSAADSFCIHQSEVAQLRTMLSKIYEYEKSKPKNTVTTRMWGVLIDSTGSSLGGFLTRWRKETRLDTAFISGSRQLIGGSFDQISGLESGKLKANN